MRPKWLMVASLVQKICTLYTFVSLLHSLLPNITFFENIFDFTTAGDRNCVAVAESFPYSFIFLSFGIMDHLRATDEA